MAITEKDKLLILFPSPLPPSFLDTLAKRFPQLRVHFEIVSIGDPRIAPGETLPDEVWDGVTLASLFRPPRAERLKNVRFVQLGSAGWDSWLEHETFLNKDVAFCCTSGVHPWVFIFLPSMSCSCVFWPELGLFVSVQDAGLTS
jgi:hypothetical protein